jgi:hypothetical protein
MKLLNPSIFSDKNNIYTQNYMYRSMFAKQNTLLKYREQMTCNIQNRLTQNQASLKFNPLLASTLTKLCTLNKRSSPYPLVAILSIKDPHLFSDWRSKPVVIDIQNQLLSIPEWKALKISRCANFVSFEFDRI